jgi:hypothetical protein
MGVVTAPLSHGRQKLMTSAKKEARAELAGGHEAQQI